MSSVACQMYMGLISPGLVHQVWNYQWEKSVYGWVHVKGVGACQRGVHVIASIGPARKRWQTICPKQKHTSMFTSAAFHYSAIGCPGFTPCHYLILWAVALVLAAV